MVRKWESSQEMAQEATQSSEESAPMETMIRVRFPWSGAGDPTQVLWATSERHLTHDPASHSVQRDEA